MTSSNTVELVNRGFRCLRDGLGDLETEEFIAIIIRERFDYTKWSQTLFENMSIDEINKAAAQYEKEHPFALASETA